MFIRTLDERQNQNRDNCIVVCNKKIYCIGGNGKVYTNEIVKGLVREFGVEIELKNMTKVMQSIKHGGALYNDDNSLIARWQTSEDPRLITGESRRFTFTIDKKYFDQLKPGVYNVVFFINDVKIISGRKVVFV